MVSVQKEWAAWIQRAVINHFNGLKRAGLLVQLPGAPDERSRSKSWIMIRLDGPRFVYCNPDAYDAIVQVDILVQTEADKNLFSLPSLLGEVSEHFTCIRVLKDDATHLGDLERIPLSNGLDLETTDYGKLGESSSLRGTVVGQYTIHLTV